MALSDSTLAIGIKRLDGAEYAQQSVVTYNPFVIPSSTGIPVGSSRWSLQQKLILDCCQVDSNNYNVSDVLVQGAKVKFGDDLSSLFVTMLSPTNQSEFVFQPVGLSSTGYPSWSLKQIIQANVHEPNASVPKRFRSPAQYGGSLAMASNNKTVELLSQFHNGSCLLLWLSDHFGDGWDTLVLTVRAPDTSNDSFSPMCSQVDPFYIRYCPYQPSDEGVYIIKPYAANLARFSWEISWQVLVESTGQWYKGDVDTKMLFNFNSTTAQFNFVSALNEKHITRTSVNTSDVYPCFRCGAITVQSWSQLQLQDASFWPIVAYGAPYYISDISARTLYFGGRVCDGVLTYECYQTLTTGAYLFRMGGGSFGKLIGFPHSDANWAGCGVSGTWRDQMIFQIIDRVCYVIQVSLFC